MLAPSQADDVPRAQGSSQSPVVTALPKGEPRHRILAQEMERICIDTLHSLFYGYPSMRVPPESRMVVKRFPSRHSLASPCGRGGRAQRGRRGQITATSNRKMLAPSQADDVPRAQGSLSHSGDSSPKGEPRHRILAQEMERICIDTLHSLFYGYPSMRVPPESRMVVNGFRPGTPCLSLWERWPSAARTERANNGNVQSENAGTFAGR